MVLVFCVEKPTLPVLSLHQFLDHLKSLYYLSDYVSFVAACVYRPPGSCTTQFLEDFLALCLQLVPI